MFVPVDECSTKIYLRSYVAVSSQRWINQVISKISSLFNPVILKQDHDVVISQFPQDVRLAHEEVLARSDKAILAFRKWLREKS